MADNRSGVCALIAYRHMDGVRGPLEAVDSPRFQGFCDAFSGRENRDHLGNSATDILYRKGMNLAVEFCNRILDHDSEWKKLVGADWREKYDSQKT